MPSFSWSPRVWSQDTAEGWGMRSCSPASGAVLWPVAVWGRRSVSLALWLSEVGGNQKAASREEKQVDIVFLTKTPFPCLVVLQSSRWSRGHSSSPLAIGEITV